jgi:hypothetical protein
LIEGAAEAAGVDGVDVAAPRDAPGVALPAAGAEGGGVAAAVQPPTTIITMTTAPARTRERVDRTGTAVPHEAGIPTSPSLPADG